MGVALRGNLKDFGLAEVFQLIGQQRKTGVLEITGGKVTMRLLFADGAVVTASPDRPGDYNALGDMLVRCGLLTRDRLVSALRASESSARPLPALLLSGGEVAEGDLEEITDLVTRESIFQVLRWSKGSFDFSAQGVPHDRPPEKLLAAEQILMDGLRMVDEWRTFAEQVPAGDAVFERAGSFSVYRQQVRGHSAGRIEAAERVFHLVDSRLSARRIIDLSRLGTFEGTRILAELRLAGLIEVMDPRTARKIQIDELPRTPLGQRLRWALAAFLPLALLGLVVWLMFDGVVAKPVPATGVPVAHSPFEAARQSYDRRRLRHALEAHRFLNGHWPDSLAKIDAGPIDRQTALTTVTTGPYYYVQRGDGILLLAPER